MTERRGVGPRWLMVVVIALVAAACSTDSGTDLEPSSATGPVAAGVGEGFALISAELDPVGDSSTSCALCLWVADTDELRRRGLMGVADLGGADGMAFVYSEPRTTSFTMRNTVLPLSIAFFDGAGVFLEVFDMEPCTAEPCPSYPTPAGFTVAIEVVQGYFEDLGLEPGARLRWSEESCDPQARPDPTNSG
jgi:uncharacterized membrane protein (UPF0127 family)